MIPLTPFDANLLLTWTALILLATYEIVSEYGSSICIDRGRLRMIAIAVALLFVAAALLRSYLIVTSFGAA